MDNDEQFNIIKNSKTKIGKINIKLNKNKKSICSIFKYIHFLSTFFISYIFIIILLTINSDISSILSYYDSIILHINQTGRHKIFHKHHFVDPETNKTIYIEPDEVHINGQKEQKVSNFCTFNETNNIIELRWNPFNYTTITNLFKECTNITFIDFSNFDSSKITDMISLFEKCFSLTSINLNNFKTNSVKKMYYMFKNCPSLISLNLSSFDTSNVTLMGFMFYYPH